MDVDLPTLFCAVGLPTLFCAVGWSFVMRFMGSPLLVEEIRRIEHMIKFS
jgi:hypothetical protein